MANYNNFITCFHKQFANRAWWEEFHFLRFTFHCYHVLETLLNWQKNDHLTKVMGWWNNKWITVYVELFSTLWYKNLLQIYIFENDRHTVVVRFFKLYNGIYICMLIMLAVLETWRSICIIHQRYQGKWTYNTNCRAL